MQTSDPPSTTPDLPGDEPSTPRTLLPFPGACPAPEPGASDLTPTPASQMSSSDIPVPGAAAPAGDQPGGASPATWIWFLTWIAAVLALFIVLALIAVPPGV